MFEIENIIGMGFLSLLMYVGEGFFEEVIIYVMVFVEVDIKVYIFQFIIICEMMEYVVDDFKCIL